MSKVKGTVSGCGKGKFSYFITLEEREGFYFNTKYEPKCGKGDVVGIEFEQKGDTRGNVKKVQVIEKNSGGYEDTSGGFDSSPSNASSSGGGGGGGARQDSIMWQSSRKDALVLTEILVENEAVKLPKNVDARRLIIEALIDETTVRYFKDAGDPKGSKAFSEVAGIEADADGDEDDDFDAPAEKKSDDDWDSWDD